ncbi:MAG: TIGR01777 family oxidoreductase [Pseudomonadales bacterium]
MSNADIQVLVTGGTGFIGEPLVRVLVEQGYRVLVLTRQQTLKQSVKNSVRYINSLDEIGDDERIDSIINLAGESLAARRWSAQQKEILVSSRLDITQQLFNLAHRLAHKPAVLVNASAIGYYGPQGDQVLNESAQSVTSFSQQLCQQWEAAAQEFRNLGARVCMLRLGIVLGPDGGPFTELRKSFDFGVASQFADGKQWMSWIHRDDVIAAVLFTLQREEIEGAVNTTAPEPVTNAQFCAAMQNNKRTFIKLNLPAFLLSTIVGEMAEELLLSGQRVVPKKLLDNGYQFKYPELQAALGDLW